MKASKAEVIQQIINATATEIDVEHRPGINKKSYSRPLLTKYGKVSKLTASISGSNTDTLGGNEVL
jgi:hypothetical protein